MTMFRTEYEVADGSPSVWYTNALRFESEDEAREAAIAKAQSWVLVRRARVVSDDTPEREPVDADDPRIVVSFA